MITPDEIRKKATRLYAAAIKAWLGGDDSYFPRRIPANLRVPKDTPQPQLIAWVESLRAGSKEQLGYGYTVEYEQIQRRTHGDNRYPQSISIESLDDLVRLLRKQTEFRRLHSVVDKVRMRLPQLDSWLLNNWTRALAGAESIDDLMLVTEYLRAHPRPDCFLRELPLPVSTKLIEKNKGLLRDWLGEVLPPEAIDFGCDPRDFEQRFGFRYPRRHLLVRLLDRQLQNELHIPWHEFSLPASEISALTAQNLKVFIVENKTNLLTLPTVPRGIAFGGLGNNLSEYPKIAWLADQPIYYWGDLDVDGLLILSRLRRIFPQTKSLLMDVETLTSHQALRTERGGAQPGEHPGDLLPHEMAAFEICREKRIRLEQEHIPQQNVNAALFASLDR